MVSFLPIYHEVFPIHLDYINIFESNGTRHTYYTKVFPLLNDTYATYTQFSKTIICKY
jgi:hypothetical protein